MRRLRGLILVIFVGFGLLLFREVLLQGRVFFWHDVSIAYMPLRKIAQEAIQAGRLPLWAPQMACGFPVQAEGQASVFYPLSALGYLGMPYYHAYSWVVFLQCLLAAVFSALLGRRLGLGWLAATFAGLAFGFSGYFVSKVLFIAFLQIGAWLPLLLLCLVSGLESGRWEWFVGAAAALAVSIYGGHPQIVFYEVLAALALLLWYALARGPVVWYRRWGRAIGGGIIALALAGGLGALQLLPTLALADFAATRSTPTPELLRGLCLKPHNLTYLVHPYLFGSYAANNYWGQDHYYEVCGYVGGITLFLALLALGVRRLPLRHKWYWVFLGVFGVFMALAQLNPLYEILPAVPGFNMFRGAGRYLLLTALSLALLAGGMIQSLAGDRRRPAGRTLTWGALAGLLACGALVVGLYGAKKVIIRVLTKLVPTAGLAPGHEATYLLEKATDKWQFLAQRLSLADPHWMAFVGGLVLAGALGLLIWRRNFNYRLAAALFLAVLAGQLYLFGRIADPTAPATFYESAPETAKVFNQLPGWGREYTDIKVEGVPFTEPPYRGWFSGELGPYFEAREVLRHNLAPLWGVLAAHGEYGLVPQRQKYLLERAMPESLGAATGSLAAPLQVLRMLGVRALIGTPGLHSPWLRVLLKKPKFWMYQIVNPMPRAWLPRQIIAAGSGEQALRGLVRADFRPEEIGMVEGLSTPQAQELRGVGGTVQVIADETTSLSFEVRTPGPAFVVLNMAYNPHWQATLKGQSARLYRANYVQFGLPVPPGKSMLVLNYEPSELRQGLRISAASLAGGLLLVLIIPLARWGSRRWQARREEND